MPVDMVDSFYYPRDNEPQEDLYRRRISFFSGVDPENLDTREVVSLYKQWKGLAHSRNHLHLAIKLLWNNRFNKFSYLNQKYDERYLDNAEGVERGKAHQQFMQQAEALADERLGYFSFGIFAPTYLGCLVNSPEESQKASDMEAKWLLIGAQTPDTLFEYQAFIRKFFHKSTPVAVDLESFRGLPYPEGVAICQGDAFVLPFGDGSFDYAATNFLFRGINKGWRRERSEARQDFFKEVIRVLRPGGSYFGIEYLGDFPLDETAAELETAGFNKAMVSPVYVFKKRRIMDHLLWNSDEAPLPEDMKILPGALAIVATK